MSKHERRDSESVADMLARSRVVLDGHFLLTSGLHSPRYLEKFRLLQYPEYTGRLCGMVAEHFRGSGVEVVAGPALGGVILAYEVARLLGVRAVYAERVGEGRGFRRGLSIESGEKTLVVDDILTTGGSVVDVVKAVQALGGEVVGVGVLIDRSGGGVEVGAPMYSCHRVEVPAYKPEECPECRDGAQITQPGGGVVGGMPSA